MLLLLRQIAQKIFSWSIPPSLSQSSEGRAVPSPSSHCLTIPLTASLLTDICKQQLCEHHEAEALAALSTELIFLLGIRDLNGLYLLLYHITCPMPHLLLSQMSIKTAQGRRSNAGAARPGLFLPSPSHPHSTDSTLEWINCR